MRIYGTGQDWAHGLLCDAEVQASLLWVGCKQMLAERALQTPFPCLWVSCRAEPDLFTKGKFIFHCKCSFVLTSPRKAQREDYVLHINSTSPSQLLPASDCLTCPSTFKAAIPSATTPPAGRCVPCCPFQSAMPREICQGAGMGRFLPTARAMKIQGRPNSLGLYWASLLVTQLCGDFPNLTGDH